MPAVVDTAEAAIARPSLSATRYLLQLEDVIDSTDNPDALDWVQDFGGGHPVGEVVATPPLSVDVAYDKHIVKVTFDEITWSIGGGMSSSMREWLSYILQGGAINDFFPPMTRVTGAGFGLDVRNRPVRYLAFSQALVSQITLPAMDARQKGEAEIRVKMVPESTERAVQPPFPALPAELPAANKKQSRWLKSNFRFGFVGDTQEMNTACERIVSIDAFTIRQVLVEADLGDVRIPQLTPTSLEVPNLVLTIPEIHAEPFYAWLDEFVVKGSSTSEKTADLEYLSPNLKSTLMNVRFDGLGIVSIKPESVETGARASSLVRVEMYCERVSLYLPG